jgi:NitT/TauT family transport system permease protein
MKPKSRSALSHLVTWLLVVISGIIATALKESVGDAAKGAIVGDRLREALNYSVSAELAKATAGTLWIFMLTCIATFISGLLLAWLMYSWRRASMFVEPIVQIMRPIPSIAMIAIGSLILSTTSSYLGILVAFLGSLWPFSIAALDAFRRVPKELRESTLTLGKSVHVFHRDVLLFAALPGLFDAMRLVAPITLLLTVTTQYFHQHLGGLGAALYEKHQGLQYPKVICIIAVLSGIGIGIESFIQNAEHRICKWKRQSADK